MAQNNDSAPIRSLHPKKNLTIDEVESKYKHTNKSNQVNVAGDKTPEPAFTISVASSEDHVDESELTAEELLAIRDDEIAELKDKLLAAYEAIINLGIGELIL